MPQNSSLAEEIKEYAAVKNLERQANSTKLRGVVRDEKKGVFKYYLEIDVASWPHLFPVVTEEDGLIETNIENHVFPKSGNLCLETRARQSYLIKSGKISSLIQFHEEVLLPHLARQYDYHNGYKDAFKGNEHRHGANGVVDGYALILNLSASKTRNLLFYIAAKIRLTDIPGNKRNKPCPCQSGKKIKDCQHENSILRKMIDEDVFKKDMKNFFPFL